MIKFFIVWTLTITSTLDHRGSESNSNEGELDIP